MKAMICIALAGLALAMSQVATARRGDAARPSDGSPRYTGDGRLVAPTDYREWVFLSAGFDMRYRERGASARDTHVFDNVFAPRAAYAAFQHTGRWPDKTVLILENRTGTSKGSINVTGHFQTGVVGLEAHVKDTARFKGGWGFFAFEGGKPAARLGYEAACYACHQQHGVVDTTFVQFYPTLAPVAHAFGTDRGG